MRQQLSCSISWDTAVLTKGCGSLPVAIAITVAYVTLTLITTGYINSLILLWNSPNFEVHHSAAVPSIS